MLGFGGRYYWGRKEQDSGKVEGIVVLFAWMSSQEKHLDRYVQLYSSLHWDSLVCHSHFLNMFFPDKATPLASDILNELVKELHYKRRPVVFVAFSGGPKACMYNVLQIIEGTSEAKYNPDDCELVKGCIAGYIYDSSPVDFTSHLGTRFVLHPSVLKMSQPPIFMSWVAKAFASSLDAIFLSRFEKIRSEYWQTLYSSATMGAPYLILCSKDDDLALYDTVSNFAQRLQQLGANVNVVKWNHSPHVGHFRTHPNDYRAAVSDLLGRALLVFSQRNEQLQRKRMVSERVQVGDSESMGCSLRKADAMSGQNQQNFCLKPTQDPALSGSMENWEVGDVLPLPDKPKVGLVHIPSLPSKDVHGVLGQVLYDVRIARNVEGWEMRPSGSLIGSPSTNSGHRQTPINPKKRIWRSRL